MYQNIRFESTRFTPARFASDSCTIRTCSNTQVLERSSGRDTMRNSNFCVITFNTQSANPPMKPIVQISLDVIQINEALETARMARRAGVDWLEAGTPLILAEGLRCVQALRAEFPDVPIVADLKTMDGGYLEAEVMAKAGATHVVVMSQAHAETIRCVVKAGRDYGVGVMGDNMASACMIDGAKRLEDLGCGYVIHHIGYDERRGIAARGERAPNPLDQLREVVAAVSVPVQAVGGLSLEQAIATPSYGAPLVVLGAPLVIDSDRFQTAGGNVEESLRRICDAVHGQTVAPRN